MKLTKSLSNKGFSQLTNKTLIHNSSKCLLWQQYNSSGDFSVKKKGVVSQFNSFYLAFKFVTN
jgi:hypothetical protein